METLSAKQKWIYSSSAVALFSMFLPWFVLGVRSDNGWETNYYVLLACWFVPLISAYNNFNWKVINIISLLIGSLAIVAFFGERASVTLFGETYAFNVGAGPYVYLLAWSAAVYSELMVSNETYDANDIIGNANQASNNEELFLKVTSDFENNKIDEALWVKSLTICDGDKEKAKYKYIREQVNKLEQELIKNNKTKKATFRNKLENEDASDVPQGQELPDHLPPYVTTPEAKLKRAQNRSLLKKTALALFIPLGGFFALKMLFFDKLDYYYCVDEIEFSDKNLACREYQDFTDEYWYCVEQNGSSNCKEKLKFSDEYLSCLEKNDDSDKYLSNVDSSWGNTVRTKNDGYRIPFTAMDGLGNKVSKVAECDRVGRLLEIKD